MQLSAERRLIERRFAEENGVEDVAGDSAI